MGSKKRSAQQKKIAQFKAELAGFDTDFASGGLEGAFARERAHLDGASERRQAARRTRACESKNRYATRQDALEAIELCAEHGTRGLRCYRCKYCHGWHLTSHPQE